MPTTFQPIASLQKYYRHSNDKNEIGWETLRDVHTIGSILQSAFGVVGMLGLSQRGSSHFMGGGWSGDLYVVHRRLFHFQNEIARYVGDSGTGGEEFGNVYEVVINSTNGWTQCISIILSNTKQASREKLEKLGMSLGYSALGKGDSNIKNPNYNKRLWLDDLVKQ